jgi:tight adherence protein B
MDWLLPAGSSLWWVYRLFILFRYSRGLIINYLWIHSCTYKEETAYEEKKMAAESGIPGWTGQFVGSIKCGLFHRKCVQPGVTDLKLMYSEEALIVQEFEGIVKQINMNRTVEEVLNDFASRSGVEDIINFAEVFATAKRTGGDIIKIIRTTGNSMNDKLEVKREVITLITGKKFEADIMSLIPIFIIIYLRLFSSDFLNPLYHNFFGIVFMTIILILYLGVYQLTRKIINIDV